MLDVIYKHPKMDVTTFNNDFLTHFQLMFHFYTPLKASENLMFSNVFRVYRGGTVVQNGLSSLLKNLRRKKVFPLGDFILDAL